MDESSFGPVLNTIVKLVAYIAPFFLIPATFKFGMGVFGNLAGMVNDRSRGLFDKQRKKRQAIQADGWNRYKTGQGKGRIRQLAPVRGAGMRTGAKTFGVGARGREKIRSLDRVTNAANAKDNAALSQLGLSSDAGIAIMGLSGGTRTGAEQARNEVASSLYQKKIGSSDAKYAGTAGAALARAEASAEADAGLAAARAVGINRTNAQTALTTHLGANKARAIAGGDTDAINRGAERLGLGSSETSEVLESFRYQARTNGRTDLGGSSPADGWGRTTMGDLSKNTTPAIKAHMSEAVADLDGTHRIVKDAAAPGGQRLEYDAEMHARRRGAAVRLLESHNLLSYTSAGNQEAINATMESLGFDDAARGAGTSVEEILALHADMMDPGDPTALRSTARVYDAQSATRNQNPGQPPQP